MAVKVIGKVIGYSDNGEIKAAPTLPDTQNERKEKPMTEGHFLDLNNVQKPKLTDTPPKDTLPKAEKIKDDDTWGENKEIAFFTEPKTVKRKTQRHIFGFQALTAATVCIIMLLLKFLVPQLYDNLHLYFLRLFSW